MIEIESRRYSAFDAAKASVLVFARGGKRFGYVHFWYVHYDGMAALLKKCMNETFATCDGLILDLRGRGGSPTEARRFGEVLRGWSRPAVALIDRDTRSAKELLASGIRKNALATLIGERTAGAVIPASFEDVGHDSVLMFPKFDMKSPLEGTGVEPDVPARQPGIFSAGADPILERGIEVLLRGDA